MKELNIKIKPKLIVIRLVQILSCFAVIPIFIYIGYYFHKYQNNLKLLFKRKNKVLPLATDLETIESKTGVIEI